jgi:allantoinase
LILLRSTRVVLPDGERPATLLIENGAIVGITTHDGVAWSATAPVGRSAEAAAERHDTDVGRSAKALAERYDYGDLVVSPGIVDTHVHVNEPGRTEWEGFDTATRAAAAGGVTTVVDMPLNSVPATTDVAALEAKRIAARGRGHVDVGFWGGVVPGNAAQLAPLVGAGVRGFKCFLAPSGVDEFPAVGERDLREAMPILARLGVPLLVHAEDPAHLTPPAGVDYGSYLASRPPQAELAAVALMIALSREYGVRVHIVHVACEEAVAAIARAKAEGVAITAETCPHYLTFAADDIPDGATEFKCAPPIRERRHRDALWRGLGDGTLDLVATDHSPAPPALKCPGDFARAWGGIASLELSLAAVWSAAQNLGVAVTPVDLARWLSERPARLAGLDGRKGRIAGGADADLMIWDPDADIRVDPMTLQQRHKLTPYAGRRLRGVVRATWLRGVRVWDDGRIAERRGELL